MKKVYMYAHGGSGNHGCEAIVRSTVKILNQMGYNEIVLFSDSPEEDIRYGVNKICDVVCSQNNYSKFSWRFIKAYLTLKMKGDFVPLDELMYAKAFSKIKKGDIVLSIGGDNYCYADVKKYLMLHDMVLRRGAKSVLWGCSVEPDVVADEEIAEDLRKYSLIIARESISYNSLKNVNPNTILTADPAFFLDSKKSDANLNKVGINLSPMVIEKEMHGNITIACYRKLIRYVLEKTDLDVLLIPHVVWEGNDDRKPLSLLYNDFCDTGRVKMLSDSSCEEIKGAIQSCKYFVGARTHSTIAAYSTGIPTLVVGYSVKARGIAKDIFGSDEHIIAVQKLETEDDLVNKFKLLIKEEKDVLKKLQEYKIFADKGLKKIEQKIKEL